MNTLIGAAWPYASGPRHLGHLAGAFLPADVIARASRLLGHDVLFVSGSDEHGTPITVAADRARVPAAAFAAEQHERIARQLAAIGISFDHYGRTTSPLHRQVVHDLFGRLRSAGLVEPGESLGAWCPSENRALPDRYVEGACPSCAATDARGDQCDNCGVALDPDQLLDPRCRVCGGAAGLRPQRQLFLRLDQVENHVRDWLAATATSWPRRWVAEEAAGAARTGLRPRAITRDLRWGIDVPLDGWSDRVLYVWFEAVIGYLSASIESRPDDWQRWWCTDDTGRSTQHRYVVGKDNVWFHALWWPAILAGVGGLRLPDDVVGSQFLTEAGEQFSVSRGHGTTIDDAIDRIGVDPLRHALIALSPEVQDVEFTWELARDDTRTGLLGSIANPAHRVATLLARRFDGRIADDVWRNLDYQGPSTAVDEALGCFERAALRQGLARVHEIGRHVNRTLAATEPWNAPDDAAEGTLASLVPWLDALAVAASPVVPEVASRLRASLGRPPGITTRELPDAPPVVPPNPQPALQ